ncbi:30S ribosomal protein S1 [bacterium]|nr:30S ribosomal protein S1 [bacterium]
MSNQQTTEWLEDESKIIIKENYSENEMEEFKNLLTKKESGKEAGSVARCTPGELLKGTIVEVTKGFVVVDVGLKSEGLIPVSEFATGEIELGNEVEVLLDAAESSNGQIILSREKARKLRRWEYIQNNFEEGSIIEGLITRKVKGGLIVDIGGMDAFLPGSQIDNKRIKSLDEYIGKSFELKILKINLERKNIVVSRREILEDERVCKKTELLEHINVGDLCKGMVKNITDFGVFLDLNGIDGLLHITDMTWKRIKHPSELVEIGDELEVKILSIDEEKGRVALGLKQKEDNPWDAIEQKFPPGTHVKGTIVNLVAYGAFIEIEPGIEGLIHVSEMSWVKNITDPSQIVNKGDEVEAIVLSIQKDEGKISLGLKQLEQNPWEDVEGRYPVGKQVSVEIRNLTNYGAFVELEPGVDGLIHISDLSWIKKVSHPSEILKKGDQVDAIILSVDKESKKITLGVKQLTSNPWDDIEKTITIGDTVSGVVTKITAFGAFVELDNGIEGLVHVTELSDQSFAKVEDIVSVGSKVNAKVLKIDREHKRISLSIKEHLVETNNRDADDIIIGGSEEEEEEKS